MNALEEFEVYRAYNNADTKPRVLNDQLLFKSNIQYCTTPLCVFVVIRVSLDSMHEQLPYSVHRLTVVLDLYTVSYTHLSIVHN